VRNLRSWRLASSLLTIVVLLSACVNQNQGAESTLAFLLASLELRLADVEVSANEAGDEAARLLSEQSTVVGSTL